jgi:hypothetical protein
MDLFVMCLSFLGWAILASIPAGLGFIWLRPYMHMSFMNAYHAMLKEALDDYNKDKGESDTCSLIISISIEHDDNTENDYPMLSYDFIEGNNFSNFDATKVWVKSEILKIKE